MLNLGTGKPEGPSSAAVRRADRTARDHAEPEGTANTNSGTGFASAKRSTAAGFELRRWHTDEMRRRLRPCIGKQCAGPRQETRGTSARLLQEKRNTIYLSSSMVSHSASTAPRPLTKLTSTMHSVIGPSGVSRVAENSRLGVRQKTWTG